MVLRASNRNFIAKSPFEVAWSYRVKENAIKVNMSLGLRLN